MTLGTPTWAPHKTFLSPLLRTLAGLALAGVAAAAAAAAPAPAPAPRLNDTGQALCVNEALDLTDQCVGTGQDGEFGRAATARDPSDGRLGFSFVKLSADGRELSADAAEWACVRDRVTGLVWEAKTRDGSEHDVSRRYLNLGDGLPGDASAFVASANARALCGARDWRLPTRIEVESLIDFSTPDGVPAIDADWFPATAREYHWTSTSARVLGGGPGYDWAVGFFRGQSIWSGGEYGAFAVRPVRGGLTPPTDRWVLRAGEALDRSTGLIWRRCSEGMSWGASNCNGRPAAYLTGSDAVDRAREQAPSSGKAWRVPNIKELSTLVAPRRRYPAISQETFPRFSLDGQYPSATHWPDNPVFDWRVEFGEGKTGLDFWGGNLLLGRDAR